MLYRSVLKRQQCAHFMNIYGRKTKYAILGIPGLGVESLMDSATVDSPFVFQGLVINNKVF